MQQVFPLNGIWYFIAVFCVTVVYYTRAYISDSSGYPSGERDQWYFEHKKMVKYSQWILSVIALVCIAIIFVENPTFFKNMKLLPAILFLVFPIVAALYYGIGATFNLRNIGWMKPFIIGFTWAGAVTLYPVLFYTVLHTTEYHFTLQACLLFIKNFMFISMLCVLFDVKDYASDSRQHLNTFVVTKGLRKTIFAIVIPLCILGLATFIIFALTRGFSPMKIALNVLPFVFIIMAAYSLHNRKQLMYYLVNIDGLMLVKGICGTLATVFF